VKSIGLDVHQATISVAVMDSQGKVVLESILETKASTLLEFFAGLRGSLFVTFEEGTWAAWLYDLLKPHVTEVLVCNPRKNALLKHGNKACTRARIQIARHKNLRNVTNSQVLSSGCIVRLSHFTLLNRDLVYQCPSCSGTGPRAHYRLKTCTFRRIRQSRGLTADSPAAARFQIKGQPEKLLSAGETFYEPPGSIHLPSGSASSTKSVRVLVVGFGKKGTEFTRPL
jgi:hypothetical protein